MFLLLISRLERTHCLRSNWIFLKLYTAQGCTYISFIVNMPRSIMKSFQSSLNACFAWHTQTHIYTLPIESICFPIPCAEDILPPFHLNLNFPPPTKYIFDAPSLLPNPYQKRRYDPNSPNLPNTSPKMPGISLVGKHQPTYPFPCPFPSLIRFLKLYQWIDQEGFALSLSSW